VEDQLVRAPNQASDVVCRQCQSDSPIRCGHGIRMLPGIVLPRETRKKNVEKQPPPFLDRSRLLSRIERPGSGIRPGIIKQACMQVTSASAQDGAKIVSCGVTVADRELSSTLAA
jgi:hypothetical protein